jgi:hypothetical protein
MVEVSLVSWLIWLARGVCIIHPLARVGCIVITLVGVAIWDAHLSGKSQLEFERTVIREELAEAYRQAEHNRLLELIEAMKPRRDLTLPAEADEGF